MAKKRIFTNPGRGNEVILGSRRSSFPYPDESARPRGKNERRPSAKPRDPEQRPAAPRDPRGRVREAPGRKTSRSSRAALVRKRNMRLGLLLAFGLVAVLLLWFFVFVYPSPIAKVNPLPRSVSKASPVEVGASFKKSFNRSAVRLVVDGKDVTGKSRVSAQSVSYKMPLADGDHSARVVVDSGGLMGKRARAWGFAVDSTPPEISILERKFTGVDGSKDIKVEFKGRSAEGSTVKIGDQALKTDAKGGFQGSTLAGRQRSLQVSATDAAGNVANTYIVTQQPVLAKGVHVSIYLAGSETDLGKMMDLVKRTELNALEIDLKDEAGQIAFPLDYPLAVQAGSPTKYVDLDSAVDRMRYAGIYTICRIVVFKDPKLAKARPDLTVHNGNGEPWGQGIWLDPYSREVWDYNVAVAVAAARAGFNEVQFDYMRFPSDGNISTCVYPHQDKRTPGEVIDGFITYARARLAPYNVFVSADLFGLTASKQGEMGIGQRVGDIAGRVDYISPMVYPSHYNAGEYGIKVPEANPHDIVLKSLQDFGKAMSGGNAQLRPWLQDFSLKVTYTPDMVRRQIDACTEAGIKQWLLWDPECTYSESALKPKT